MPPMPRQLAAAAITVVALGGGAAPALAKAKAPLAAPIKAKTPLIAKIAKDTSIIHERLPDRLSGVYASLQQDANACRGYALFVGRMPADRAQRPAQLEWVKGVREQQLGDDLLRRGIIADGKLHPTATGIRETNAGLAHLRIANDDIRHALTLLGIPHAQPSVRLPTKVVY
jgi:hypothetical protein